MRILKPRQPKCKEIRCFRANQAENWQFLQSLPIQVYVYRVNRGEMPHIRQEMEPKSISVF